MKISASLRLTSAAALLALGLATTQAQTLGDITTYVISPANENSVKVRVIGVNDYPVNPIGGFGESGPRSDGSTYTWTAFFVGDGLVDVNDVNVAVVMGYNVKPSSGITQWAISYNVECPYPITSFTHYLYFDGTNNISEPLTRYSWYTNSFQLPDPIPSMIFGGTIVLKDGKLTLDVTFTGGSPVVTVADVTRLVNESSIAADQKKSLLKILSTAQSFVTGGNCAKATKQLQTFQNKVRAQVSDRILASTLTGAAQDVIAGSQ